MFNIFNEFHKYVIIDRQDPGWYGLENWGNIEPLPQLETTDSALYANNWRQRKRILSYYKGFGWPVNKWTKYIFKGFILCWKLSYRCKNCRLCEANTFEGDRKNLGNSTKNPVAMRSKIHESVSWHHVTFTPPAAREALPETHPIIMLHAAYLSPHRCHIQHIRLGHNRAKVHAER